MSQKQLFFQDSDVDGGEERRPAEPTTFGFPESGDAEVVVAKLPPQLPVGEGKGPEEDDQPAAALSAGQKLDPDQVNHEKLIE